MSCVNLKNNRYKIIHTYNANVYRVMDELSTCVYILKICPDYETKRYKHQFKTEINVLSNLNSIHVPSLITCFEEDFAQCLSKHIFRESTQDNTFKTIVVYSKSIAC